MLSFNNQFKDNTSSISSLDNDPLPVSLTRRWKTPRSPDLSQPSLHHQSLIKRQIIKTGSPAINAKPKRQLARHHYSIIPARPKRHLDEICLAEFKSCELVTEYPHKQRRGGC